jgi:hypothetical protein
VGSFKLKELDGTVLSRSFTGSQLKRFVKSGRYFAPDREGESGEGNRDREGGADSLASGSTRVEIRRDQIETRSKARRRELQLQQDAKRLREEEEEVQTQQARN